MKIAFGDVILSILNIRGEEIYYENAEKSGIYPVCEVWNRRSIKYTDFSGGVLYISLDADLYLLGNVVGWIISVANAFFWNNRYVFRSDTHSKGALLKRVGKTYLCYGATFLLSTLLLYLQVDIIGWSKQIAPLVNLLVTIPLNFLLNKFWTFKG